LLLTLALARALARAARLIPAVEFARKLGMPGAPVNQKRRGALASEASGQRGNSIMRADRAFARRDVDKALI
jgi:hypothetical protein